MGVNNRRLDAVAKRLAPTPRLTAVQVAQAIRELEAGSTSMTVIGMPVYRLEGLVRDELVRLRG